MVENINTICGTIAPFRATDLHFKNAPTAGARAFCQLFDYNPAIDEQINDSALALS